MMTKSMTQFKRQCVKHGVNPAVATALKRMVIIGRVMPVEDFTQEWVKFCSKYPSWNRAMQLAQKEDFSFIGTTNR